MEIQQNDQAFYIGDDYSTALARLVFRNTDFGMVLEHTEVDASLAGQGIGRALVKFAVEVARNEKFLLAVECAYAQLEFKKHPDYEDVLYSQ